jgi:hypothetical protein
MSLVSKVGYLRPAGCKYPSRLQVSHPKAAKGAFNFNFEVRDPRHGASYFRRLLASALGSRLCVGCGGERRALMMLVETH